MSFHPDNSPSNLYHLRWRFDFSNGKPSKWGMWDSPGPKGDLATKAWCHNGESLLFASVEGKNRETGHIVTLLQVPGEDYVNFQWDAAAIVNPGFVGTVTPIHRLVGLRLIARDSEYVVRATGETETVPRSEASKLINFATFGR